MIWDRPVPEAWASRLRELYPPSEKLAHVECWWDAGTEAHPVQRWVLVECVPEQAVSVAVKDRLLLDPDATPFRRRMVDYWQQHQKIPFAFWVIQGTGGGNKLDYSPIEQQWDQWIGGEGKAPEAGSLPYADFDERVIHALAVHDRLLRAVKDFEVSDKLHEETTARKMREAFHAWAGERAAFMADMALPAILAADLPKTDGEPDYEAKMDQYVETGSELGHSGGFQSGPTALLKPA